jgi:hypothetical protein
VTADIVRKKEHEAKILFTNQRSPAEQGPCSYPQLYWWSLIAETLGFILLGPISLKKIVWYILEAESI